MALFGRRRETRAEPQPSRFAAEAAAQGWESVGPDAIPERVRQVVHRSARVLYGAFGNVMGPDKGSPDTSYDGLFRTSINGRGVVVVNLATNVQPTLLRTAQHTTGASACIVEVPSVLAISCIQPRDLHPVDPILPEQATGNPAFDARYRVQVRPGFGPAQVTDAMQQQVMTRDDWIFASEHTSIINVAKGGFESVPDMRRRIDDVLAFVAAIPTSMLAAEVDHSTDDLIARIDKLTTIDDAIALLQSLTPEDRQRLAQSKTPLARFADVHTAEEAFARFDQLDAQEQMQIISMFNSPGGT